MENLLVALPWNVDHRSGDSGQCGGRTPVTIFIEPEGVVVVTSQPSTDIRTLDDSLEHLDRNIDLAGIAHMDQPIPEFRKPAVTAI